MDLSHLMKKPVARLALGVSFVSMFMGGCAPNQNNAVNTPDPEPNYEMPQKDMDRAHLAINAALVEFSKQRAPSVEQYLEKTAPYWEARMHNITSPPADESPAADISPSLVQLKEKADARLSQDDMQTALNVYQKSVEHVIQRGKNDEHAIWSLTSSIALVHAQAVGALDDSKNTIMNVGLLLYPMDTIKGVHHKVGQGSVLNKEEAAIFNSMVSSMPNELKSPRFLVLWNNHAKTIATALTTNQSPAAVEKQFKDWEEQKSQGTSPEKAKLISQVFQGMSKATLNGMRSGLRHNRDRSPFDLAK